MLSDTDCAYQTLHLCHGGQRKEGKLRLKSYSPTPITPTKPTSPLPHPTFRKQWPWLQYQVSQRVWPEQDLRDTGMLSELAKTRSELWRQSHTALKTSKPSFSLAIYALPSFLAGKEPCVIRTLILLATSDILILC